MTERVPCAICGKLILHSTAERTEGLCMPCKGGYRKDIEASIQRREVQKEYRESSERKHWISLVDRVYKQPQGFDALSPQEQKFFAMSILIGEVRNGGFDQYFSNSSGDYYLLTLVALSEIGAATSFRMLVEAKEIIFGENPVPTTQTGRLATFPPYPEDSQPDPQDWSSRLDALDRQFWKHPDDLPERIEKYAQDNALRSDF
jgi:Domain of unknown function (DUF4375)